MADFDHHFRFNPGDYVADTLHLTTLQHGMYWLLLIHCFKRGSIPDDPKQLRTITKVSAWHWRKHSGPVLALFQHDEKICKYLHKRISKLIRENMAAIGQKVDDSRAREPETKNQEESPRRSPHSGDPRGADQQSPRQEGTNPRAKGTNPRANRRRPSRNGFVDLILDELEERDAQDEDARRSGARVVPLPRRVNGGKS